MVAMGAFSGLMSSACAFASAEAIAPIGVLGHHNLSSDLALS